MKLVSLNKLCDINIGKTPSRNKSIYWGNGAKWVSISDITDKIITCTKEEITETAIKECNMKLVPKGTVIMSFKLTIGKVAIVGDDMYTNEAIVSLPIKDKSVLDPNYLYYVLQTLNLSKVIDRAVKGATLNKSKLNQIQIPLPPLETQKKIADTLDKAQSLIDKRKEQIAKLNEFLQSVFLDMFGDPARNPKGWSVIDLKDAIVDVKNGLSKRRKTPENVGQVVLRLKDIRLNSIDFSDLNRIELDDKEKDKYLVRNGDLLFIRVNGNPDYVGRCAVFNGFNESVYFNDHIMRVRIDNSLFNSTFLAYYLNSRDGKTKIAKHLMTSAGQYTINQKGLESLKIYKPNINNQNKFAQIVEKTEKHKALLQKSLAEMENLFNSIMQKAFRGELFTGH